MTFLPLPWIRCRSPCSRLTRVPATDPAKPTSTALRSYGRAAHLALLLLLGAGCTSDSERLARFAEQTGQQQAEQNQATAETSRQALKTTEQLIASQEQSRQELVRLAQQLQAQQAALQRRQTELFEAQRRWLGRLGMIACVALLVGAGIWLHVVTLMREASAQPPGTSTWVALNRAPAKQLPGSANRRLPREPVPVLPPADPRPRKRQQRRRRRK